MRSQFKEVRLIEERIGDGGDGGGSTQAEQRPLSGQDSRFLASACAGILDEHKLDEITILHVGESLHITDYFVVATGLNPRHLKAAGDRLFAKVREMGIERHGVEGYSEGKWVLIDLVDVVVHLFEAESRKYYDLELLWGDCERVEWRGAFQEGGSGAGDRSVNDSTEADGSSGGESEDEVRRVVGD